MIHVTEINMRRAEKGSSSTWARALGWKVGIIAVFCVYKIEIYNNKIQNISVVNFVRFVHDKFAVDCIS